MTAAARDDLRMGRCGSLGGGSFEAVRKTHGNNVRTIPPHISANWSHSRHARTAPLPGRVYTPSLFPQSVCGPPHEYDSETKATRSCMQLSHVGLSFPGSAMKHTHQLSRGMVWLGGATPAWVERGGRHTAPQVFSGLQPHFTGFTYRRSHGPH